MRRTPLNRGTSQLRRTGPPKRRTRLRWVSDKRLGERDQRRWAIEEVRYRDGDRCAAIDAGLIHVCSPGPFDAHEVIPRSVWPGGHLVPSNIRLVCRRAHSWIGDHPREAWGLGLHGYAHERPDT